MEFTSMYGEAGGAVEAGEAVDDARLRVRAHAARAAVRAHREHVRGAAQRGYCGPAGVDRYCYVLYKFCLVRILATKSSIRPRKSMYCFITFKLYSKYKCKENCRQKCFILLYKLYYQIITKQTSFLTNFHIYNISRIGIYVFINLNPGTKKRIWLVNKCTSTK